MYPMRKPLAVGSLSSCLLTAWAGMMAGWQEEAVFLALLISAVPASFKSTEKVLLGLPISIEVSLAPGYLFS